MNDCLKTVTVNNTVVTVPATPKGLDIKQCAHKAGIEIGQSWRLHGHSSNGTCRPIGDGDYPWEQHFTAEPMNG